LSPETGRGMLDENDVQEFTECTKRACLMKQPRPRMLARIDNRIVYESTGLRVNRRYLLMPRMYLVSSMKRRKFSFFEMLYPL